MKGYWGKGTLADCIFLITFNFIHQITDQKPDPMLKPGVEYSNKYISGLHQKVLI